MAPRGTEIEGLTELVRNLERINKEVAFDVVPRAMNNAANFMLDRVKEKTPVGPTGELRRRTVVVRSKTQKYGFTWRVWAKAPHSHLVEFGHRIVRNGREFGFVRGYPYMRPAFDAHKDDAIRMIENQVRGALDRV